MMIAILETLMCLRGSTQSVLKVTIVILEIGGEWSIVENSHLASITGGDLVCKPWRGIIRNYAALTCQTC